MTGRQKKLLIIGDSVCFSYPVWGNWSPCGYVKWLQKFAA